MEKPFPPSARRHRQAAERGDVARSPALAGLVALVVVGITARWQIDFVRAQLAVVLARAASAADAPPSVSVAGGATVVVLVAAALAAGALISAGAVSSIAPGPLAPPRHDGGVGAAWSAARGLAVALVVAAILAGATREISSTVAWRLADPAHAARAALVVGARFIASVSALAVVVVLADRARALAAWRERWSMTRAEAIADARAASVDPRVRRRQREAAAGD